VFVKKGSRALIEGRKKRILYPLIAFWPVIFPSAGAGMLFLMGGFENGEFQPTAFVNHGNVASVLSPLHLWFLYYLLYFYAGFLLLEKLLKKVPVLRQKSEDAFEYFFHSPFSVVFFSMPLAVVLYLGGGKIDAVSTFIPDLGALGTYFIFFAFGRFLYQARSGIDRFQQQIVPHLLLALVLLVALEKMRTLNSQGEIFLASAAGALCAWSFIFSITGFCLRFLSGPSKVLGYLAESSYWFYIIHLPLVIWLVFAFKGHDLASPLKVVLVLSITFFILLVSYELAVRRTIIGRFLSGH
jgi:surface polysaccharide O-acyltransferase-like enzyme